MRSFFSASIKEVNLCLGGGGALGFAHIGAIKALEENGIFATEISGTSMGAIVGMFYAAGYSPDKMLEIIEKEKLYKLSNLFSFKLNILKEGLTQSNALRSLIRNLIPHNSFEGLEKKLTVCVSQMNLAQSKFISSGSDLDKWVIASASLPAIFEPIREGVDWYLDGGVFNNFPAQCFADKKTKTIGVDVLPSLQSSNSLESKSTIGVLQSVIRVTEHNNSREGRSCCRYLIEPMSSSEFNAFSFNSYRDIIQIGYDQTQKYIAENPRILRLSKKKN